MNCGVVPLAGPDRQRHRIIAADINPPAIGLAIVFDRQRRIAGPQFAQRDLGDPLDLLYVSWGVRNIADPSGDRRDLAIGRSGDRGSPDHPITRSSDSFPY